VKGRGRVAFIESLSRKIDELCTTLPFPTLAPAYHVTPAAGGRGGTSSTSSSTARQMFLAEKKLSAPRERDMNAASAATIAERLETASAENRILRQKLQSKSQALLILSGELERARREADDCRQLADRLQKVGGHHYHRDRDVFR